GGPDRLGQQKYNRTDRDCRRVLRRLNRRERRESGQKDRGFAFAASPVLRPGKLAHLELIRAEVDEQTVFETRGLQVTNRFSFAFSAVELVWRFRMVKKTKERRESQSSIRIPQSERGQRLLRIGWVPPDSFAEIGRNDARGVVAAQPRDVASGV